MKVISFNKTIYIKFSLLVYFSIFLDITLISGSFAWFCGDDCIYLVIAKQSFFEHVTSSCWIVGYHIYFKKSTLCFPGIIWSFKYIFKWFYNDIKGSKSTLYMYSCFLALIKSVVCLLIFVSGWLLKPLFISFLLRFEPAALH